MKIIDISREMMSASVYPGDPSASLEPLCRMEWGDVCNTSSIHGCLHNGTHLDAPLHFVPEANDVCGIPLEMCVGECYVLEHEGPLVGAQAEAILERVHLPRILFKGNMQITPSAAFVLSGAGLCLIGVEAQSVSAAETTAQVHRQLLSCEVVLLEGLDLSQAKEGRYLLVASPLKVKGADGSPVRAILLEYGG